MKNCKEIRLIDANELEQKLLDEFNQSGEYTPYEYALGEVLNYLNEQPTIDPDSLRPHGKWIICSDGYYPYCSECKEEPKGGNMTKFCPNCGAKMEGDK